MKKNIQKFIFFTVCILMVSFFSIRTVFAQVGKACQNNQECTETGFTCDTTTKTCVLCDPSVSSCADQSSQPVPTQTEGTSDSAGGNTGGSAGTIGCHTGQDCVSLTNPLSSTDIPKIIGSVIQVVMGIVGSVTLVIFLYGGFLWLTSAGNAEKISKGLQAMLWATIGIIVVFSSYAILTLILQTLQASP